jgi:hypothetical protein
MTDAAESDRHAVLLANRRAVVPSRTFHFEGLRIRLECEDASLLDWTTEFLAPACTVRDGDPPDVVVTLVLDSAQYADLLSEDAGRPQRELVCFVQDGGATRVRARRGDGGEEVCHDPQLRSFYVAAQDRTRFGLVAGGDRAHARVAAMRVLRELAMAHVHGRGRLLVHGAAVAVAERGIVISGPKSSGKTTLLTYVLDDGRGAYVANDRVVVDTRTPSFPVRGIPTIVNYREGTRDWFPAFWSRLRSSPFRHPLTVAEATSPGAPNLPGARWAQSLSPAQLCNLLGASAVGGAALGVLVFPELTAEVNAFELDRLGPADAEICLRAGLLNATAPDTVSEVFAPVADGQPGSDHGSIAQACATLASGVPAFTCRLGRRAYQGSALAERLAALAS